MRSWQLIVAAQAFVKFSPRLRGIDIIIARQRKGTLLVEEEVEKSTNVTDMPLEVLEEIRSKVFSKRELGSAARQLVQVPGGGSNGWKKMPRPHDDDDWALDHYNECVSEVRFGHRSIDNPVTALLEYYGLELASDGMGNQEDWEIENGSTLYRDFQFDVVSDFSSTPPIPTVTSVAASATATVVNDKTSTEGGGSKLGDSDILGSLKPRWTVWMSVDPAY